MKTDNSCADIMHLVRHMAGSGRFKDVVAIEATLIMQGRGAQLDQLEHPALRAELELICLEANRTADERKRA